jgi:hypothetical protein
MKYRIGTRWERNKGISGVFLLINAVAIVSRCMAGSLSSGLGAYSHQAKKIKRNYLTSNPPGVTFSTGRDLSARRTVTIVE